MFYSAYHGSQHYGSRYYRQEYVAPAGCGPYYGARFYASQHYGTRYYRQCPSTFPAGYPLPSQVLEGVVYGPSNEYTGTLNATTGGNIILMRRR